MLGGYHYNNLREALLKQVTLPHQFFLVSSSALLGEFFSVAFGLAVISMGRLFAGC